jgi:diguanylate cyclase (GGDEF)-like protein
MSDGVFIADGSLSIHFANPALEGMLRLESGALPLSLDELYPEPGNSGALSNARAALGTVGFWNGEMARTDATGTICIDELTVALAPGLEGLEDRALRYVGIVRDVTKAKEARERLLWAQRHDKLTGLPDRAQFSKSVQKAILQAKAGEGAVAVIMADLDNFKRFNTDYGHEEGDCILKAAALRLQNALSAGQYLARTGGDEFSILTSLRSPGDAAKAAERIRDSFLGQLRTDKGRYELRASIGVAVWPQDGQDQESLLSAADLAMQSCKNQGKDGVLRFDQGIFIKHHGKSLLEAELRTAIERDQIQVHYQPIIRVKDGLIEGVEALARWKHPLQGDVAPDSFIALAEETGLIQSLGRSVLSAACAQASLWCRANAKHLRVAVNISAMQLERGDFTQLVLEAIDGAGLAPENLTVEITESVLLSKLAEAGAALTTLKALGVAVSVDDFGTGYSSLNYIKDLPVDSLKIDREFVRDMTRSSVAMEIVNSTIAMAHRINLRVVAEGVENAEQFYLLRSMGCDSAQGYLFGKALPAAEIEGRYLCRGGSRYSSYLFQ